MGTGQEREKLCSLAIEVNTGELTSVPVVRRTGTFTGHHRGTERMFGCAAAPERRTIHRLLDSDRLEAEFEFGIKRRVRRTQGQSTPRNFAESTPFARHY